MSKNIIRNWKERDRQRRKENIIGLVERTIVDEQGDERLRKTLVNHSNSRLSRYGMQRYP